MNPLPRPVILATRGSALALAQARQVLADCQTAFPEQVFELRILKTTGDKLQTASLSAPGLPKGLFTKEIEEALLSREADLAVHSLKDLPTELPTGLKLGAVTQRADARDVLIYRDLETMIRETDPTRDIQQNRRGYRPSLSLHALPGGSTIGTSSTRRSAQALEARPDLTVAPIRGNVGTRLRKLCQQAELDATLLALAGLQRLHYQITPDGRLKGHDLPRGLAATPISLSEMVPCVGQGAIGIEIRENDPELEAICQKLGHTETRDCVTAERAFLEAMGGGCHLAIGAHARVVNGELSLSAVSYLGGAPKRGQARGQLTAAGELGKSLAAELC